MTRAPSAPSDPPRAAFPVIVAAATLAALAFELDPTTQLLAIAPIAVVLGLPHGALDLEIARRLYPLGSVLRNAVFVSGYIGLAACVVAFWIAAPLFGLALFLAYSAAHFADDWRDDLGRVGRLVVAAAVIAGPICWRPEEVQQIFALMTGSPSELSAFVDFFGAIGGAAYGGALIVALFATRLSPAARAEILALLVLCAAAPPLVFFAIYFCALHSPRHLLRTAATLGVSTARAVRLAAPITGVTLAGAGIAAAAFLAAGAASDAASAQIVFIGLAALTVPHMALVDRLLDQKHRSKGLRQ